MRLTSGDGAGLLRLWRGSRLMSALFLATLYAALILIDATAATAVAAGLALIGAIFTLDHADATARRTRTAEYRARWDHPDLLEARIAAAEFLDAPADEYDDHWQEWLTEMPTRRRLHLMAILNFWEEVSSAYNQDYLDNGWFETDLAWELQYAWERAEWFIRKYREEDRNASGYCEWQSALETVKPSLDRQKDEGCRQAESALKRGEDLLYVGRRAGTGR